VRASPLRHSGVDHTVLPANTPHLPLLHSSTEGATTEWTVIAPDDEAYYSLIDPMRMKGWVGLVSWPTADGLPIYMVTHQLQVQCRDQCSTTEPPIDRNELKWSWYCTILTFVPSSVFLSLFAESHSPDAAPFWAPRTNHVSPSSVQQVFAPTAATISTQIFQVTHHDHQYRLSCKSIGTGMGNHLRASKPATQVNSTWPTLCG